MSVGRSASVARPHVESEHFSGVARETGDSAHLPRDGVHVEFLLIVVVRFLQNVVAHFAVQPFVGVSCLSKSED